MARKFPAPPPTVAARATEPKQVKLQWFARTSSVARAGPFVSYAEAARYTLGVDGLPLAGAFVWPVEVPSNPPSTR